jgi:hypothetical protein
LIIPPPSGAGHTSNAKTRKEKSMKIVTVQFQNKKDPQGFAGREYTYFSKVDLNEGDIIFAPIKSGEGLVRVCRVNVADSEIDDKVRSFIRTIEELKKPKTVSLSDEFNARLKAKESAE